ncbi:PREDICTED: mitogen-activated protein kinase kinase kinase 7-like [Drosophila arizonae]|uniref:Mitogen-activated protein kinase kinase kinase 7-like n=1 Tax=Drosophila arizonae TaxID=7263 RepID=A0ABM1Q636_DROAR|nr:PREDICTED: mitogen-activated protein kinase kinase kinase 7-like [Drosophila arizonae]
MHSIKADDLTLGEVLGQGNNGKVFKARWHTKDVAVKEIFLQNINKSTDNEITELLRANHENIVFLHGTAIKNNILYLVMELVDGGSLENLIYSEQINYDLAHVINWALQIAKGIQYMHSKKLVHRDIRPYHILLCDSYRHVKICEFSFVRSLGTSMTNNRGTATYMAPEVFTGKKYTEKCDVYSYAIALWEMLSRDKPYNSYDTNLQISKAVLDGERPSLDDINISCPEKIKELLTSCWSTDPNERYSMTQIIDVLSKYPIVVEQLRL